MFYVLDFDDDIHYHCWERLQCKFKYKTCPIEGKYAAGPKGGITMLVTKAKAIVPIIHTGGDLGTPCARSEKPASRGGGFVTSLW
jgi:hypothetical protein